MAPFDWFVPIASVYKLNLSTFFNHTIPYKKYCNRSYAIDDNIYEIDELFYDTVILLMPSSLDLFQIRSGSEGRFFLPRISHLWNKIPRDYFPTDYNIVVFKSNVNKYE